MKLEYLPECELLLEFDPLLTAAGKLYQVNQTVELVDQKITITEIEVCPSHLRVNVLDAKNNTARIRELDFYIKTDTGIRFDTSNGITATHPAGIPGMISYWAESTYFYDAEQLKLVITRPQFLDEITNTTYVNLVNGETGLLPEGVAFESTVREGEDWIVISPADWDEDEPMHQMFGSKFHDADWNEYEINQWRRMFGEAHGEGNITYFLDRFPLKNNPYDEVWLSLHYSHYWTVENLIVINIQ